MIADCKAKRHTTFTEAIQVSLDMQAQASIMTHFSQRYSKMLILDEFEVEKAEKVGVAFDFTRVNPRTFRLIRETYPALRIIHKDAIDEVEENQDKAFQSKNKKNLEDFGDETFEDNDEQPNVKKLKLGPSKKVDKGGFQGLAASIGALKSKQK